MYVDDIIMHNNYKIKSYAIPEKVKIRQYMDDANLCWRVVTFKFKSNKTKRLCIIKNTGDFLLPDKLPILTQKLHLIYWSQNIK